jgi:uncharacterized membrane protein
MNSVAGAMAGKVLLAGVIMLYPLAVYFLIDSVGAAGLGILLLVLLLFRLKPLARLLPGTVYYAVAAVVIAGAIALFGDSEIALKSYPTIISVVLLAVFGYTLYRPPSMVERIARAAGSDFSERAGPYTRAVTLVWCIFFAVNATVSATISMTGSLRAWTLYNGFIAYGIVGTLIVGEWLFRRAYKRRGHISGDVS